MSTMPTGLEILPIDPWDDAMVDAWHEVYRIAETHELGSAATDHHRQAVARVGHVSKNVKAFLGHGRTPFGVRLGCCCRSHTPIRCQGIAQCSSRNTR